MLTNLFGTTIVLTIVLSLIASETFSDFSVSEKIKRNKGGKNRRKRLLSKITLALRKLNDIELQVFDLTFYKCKDEDEIMDIISYGKDKVRYIKKSACIKFVSALGLDDRCFK